MSRLLIDLNLGAFRQQVLKLISELSNQFESDVSNATENFITSLSGRYDRYLAYSNTFNV